MLRQYSSETSHGLGEMLTDDVVLSYVKSVIFFLV